MYLMTKNGAFMNAYNAKEVDRLKSKGWEIHVPEPVKKTRKKRAAK